MDWWRNASHRGGACAAVGAAESPVAREINPKGQGSHPRRSPGLSRRTAPETERAERRHGDAAEEAPTSSAISSKQQLDKAIYLPKNAVAKNISPGGKLTVMKPYPFFTLNHLTLPVIFDICIARLRERGSKCIPVRVSKSP
jgi:hypothetical protein